MPPARGRGQPGQSLLSTKEVVVVRGNDDGLQEERLSEMTADCIRVSARPSIHIQDYEMLNMSKLIIVMN